MKYTSSQIAKLLRKLAEEKETLTGIENHGSTFIVASGEDEDSIRPEYDYAETQKKISEIDARTVRIKHALNLFNSTSKLPGYDITVDQALIMIPQLTARKNRLDQLRSNLPKTREMNMRSGSIIDYRVANYDPKQAQADYEKASDELAKLQTALDLFNTTVTFELDE
jgi:hypothetical protein